MDIAQSIADGIARMEGFYAAGSIAQRNNNPGNLRSGVGQSGTSGGYAVFPDLATGWAALIRQVQLNIARGLTLSQFFGGGNGYPGYAPAADSNQPNVYTANVAQWTGIDPNVPLNQIGGPAPPDPFTGNPPESGSPFVNALDFFSSATAPDIAGNTSLDWWTVGLAVGGLLLIIWLFDR